MILDTWLGIGSKRDGGNTVRSDTAPTYSDVTVKEGVKSSVVNPPKPIAAQWTIGFNSSKRPTARLLCVCRTVSDFELGGLGIAPVAKCCKNALAYPQNREYTAHLLITTLGQTGLPPEPGTGPGLYPNDAKFQPGGPRTGDGLSQAEIVALTRAEEKELAGAAKDAELIEAARREHAKHLK